MTRKDYYLIAESLAKCASLGQDKLLYVADMIAHDLQKDNPAFKRELFLKTAGVTEKTIEDSKLRYVIVDEASDCFGRVGAFKETIQLSDGLNMYYLTFDDGFSRGFLAYQIEADHA